MGDKCQNGGDEKNQPSTGTCNLLPTLLMRWKKTWAVVPCINGAVSTQKGSESRTPKEAIMPKSSAGYKRAHALIQYFGSRASDPRFEIYTWAHAQPTAPSGKRKRRACSTAGNGVKVEDAMEVNSKSTSTGNSNSQEEGDKSSKRRTLNHRLHRWVQVDGREYSAHRYFE